MPTAPTPTPTPPAPTPLPQLGTRYSLTATLISVTGAGCKRLEGLNGPPAAENRREIFVEKSGTTIRLWDPDDPYSNGFGTAYEGEVTGTDFATSDGEVGTVRCSDETELINVLGTTDLVGRFSEDDRDLTATVRVSWRQTPGDIELTTLTWAWTATRK